MTKIISLSGNEMMFDSFWKVYRGMDDKIYVLPKRKSRDPSHNKPSIYVYHWVDKL